MFAIFKKGFKFRFPDGNFWKVGKDYMGDVPAAVANHPLFKAAVAGGDIMTPDTHRDKDIHTAEDRAALAAAKRLAELSGVCIDDIDTGFDLDAVVEIRDGEDEAKSSNAGVEINLAVQIIFRHFAVRIIYAQSREPVETYGLVPYGERMLRFRTKTRFTWIGSRLNIGVAKYAFHIMVREARKEWRKVAGWGLKKGSFMIGFYHRINQELERNPLRNDIDKLKAEDRAAQERLDRLIKERDIAMRRIRRADHSDTEAMCRGYDAAEHVRLSRPMDGGGYAPAQRLGVK
jgi:hypothetical protein